MKTTVILLLCLLITGCAIDDGTVRKLNAQLPEYMQENIGPVEIGLRPLHLITWGYVYPKDIEGTIYLSPFASKNVYFEEAFHSFEIRAGHSRYGEWLAFYNAFGQPWTGGKLYALACMTVPLPRQYINHFERTAHAFKQGDNQAIINFVNGYYRKEVNAKVNHHPNTGLADAGL